MHPLPHRYRIEASGLPEGGVRAFAAGLEALEAMPPPQFDGPGNHWSPETLLLAAAADCFVLTFRSVARSAELSWIALDCEAEGVLDRTADGLRFTELALVARLVVAEGTSREHALRALQRAERGCLVSNSLKVSRSLSATIETLPEAAVGDPA